MTQIIGYMDATELQIECSGDITGVQLSTEDGVIALDPDAALALAAALRTAAQDACNEAEELAQGPGSEPATQDEIDAALGRARAAREAL